MRMMLAAVSLVLFIGAGIAPAEEPGFCNWYEKQAWEHDGEEWVPMERGNAGVRARVWMEIVNYEDSCNKRDWEIPFKAEASIAQWIILGINGDGFHWGVRKPGYYASDCIWLWFRSNYDVEIGFEDFDNLITLYPDSCIDDTIEVWYALSPDSMYPPSMESELWKTPAELSRWTYRVRDSYDLHWTGWRQKIWTKIYVSPCNTSCEYVDPDWAKITLTLQRIKPWIAPETGLFSGRPRFPFQ